MSGHIDLSHVIEDAMVTYPGLPGPVISDFLSREASRSHYAPGTEFHIGKIEMVANTGTYLDVPRHRFADGYGLEDLPLDRIAGVSGVAISATRSAIEPDVMEGVDAGGKAVLFNTGWSRHWGTAAYGNADHPYLTADVVDELVRRGAAIVGIDSVNIDDTRGGERPAHSGLLAAGIPIVEHLTGLAGLIDRSFTFTAVPARVRGLGSWPVRAFATLD